MRYVSRRIGGLEKTFLQVFLEMIVSRRIGGLEIFAVLVSAIWAVSRRIGGLEKLARQRHTNHPSFPPNRRLRNMVVINQVYKTSFPPNRRLRKHYP